MTIRNAECVTTFGVELRRKLGDDTAVSGMQTFTLGSLGSKNNKAVAMGGSGADGMVSKEKGRDESDKNLQDDAMRVARCWKALLVSHTRTEVTKDDETRCFWNVKR